MTKQELYYLWDLRQQLEDTLELLASLEAKAAPRVQRLDGLPHASGTRDAVGDLAAGIADLKERIYSLECGIIHSEAVATAYIRTIEDSRTRIIFTLRFIHGKSWKDVAKFLGGGNTAYSVKAICYRYLEAHHDA